MHESENKCLNKNSLDLTELIRSLQRLEGNPDCFGKAKGHCSQLDCAWRQYCLDDENVGGRK